MQNEKCRNKKFLNQELYDEYKLFNEPKFEEILLKSLGTIYMSVIITSLISMSLLEYFSVSTVYEYFVKFLIMYLYLTSIAGYMYLFICVYLSEQRNKRVYSSESNKMDNFRIKKLPNWYIMIFRDEEEMPRYLEFGYIIIGTATMVCALFQLEQSIKTHHSFIITSCIVEFVFFFIQLVFIIKHNSLIILSHMIINKIIIANMILTNICKWLSTSFTKLPVQNCDTTDKNCIIHNHSKKLPFFLLPCVSEFCILSVAILYDLFMKIGKSNCVREANTTDNETTSKTIQKLKPFLKGLMAIICLVLYTVESLVGFFAYGNRPLIVSVIYQNEEIIFNIMGISLSFSIFYTIKNYYFTFAMYHNYFEQHLLLISAVVSIFNCLYTLGFVVDQFTDGSNSKMDYTVLIYQTVSIIIEIINISVQTVVINDAFYRCMGSASAYCISKSIDILTDPKDFLQQRTIMSKPAANRILTLFGINIVQWMNKSFKSPFGNVFTNKYIGIKTIKTQNINTSVGNVFYYMSLPLLLLFHFHISICICDLFHKLYETMPIRYERVIRNEGFLHFKSKRFRSVSDTETSPTSSTLKERISFSIAKQNVIRDTDNVRKLLKTGYSNAYKSSTTSGTFKT